MAFQILPIELLVMIGDHADNMSLRSLCMASRWFMDIFQEKAYHTAELDDTPKSADRLSALGTGPRGTLVRTVRYVPRDPYENNPAKQGRLALLRSILFGPDLQRTSKTNQALGFLSMFPSLQKLQFDLGCWDTKKLKENFGPAYYPCCLQIWQRLIETRLHAIGNNAIGTFAHLEIKSLPLKALTRYRSDLQPCLLNWRAFLSSLKTFEISVAEVNKISFTKVHYQELLISLPYDFFIYLKHVENLRISGAENFVIGFPRNVWSMDWTLIYSPDLRSCEIEYSHVTISMVRFIANHIPTLQRLCLRNCFGRMKRDWLELFRVLLNHQPTELVEFEIVSYPVRLRYGQSDYLLKGDICGYDMSEEAKTEKMRRFPVGRVSAYCDIRFVPIEMVAEREDDPELDESDVIERWEQLEELMERNRRRLAGQ